MGLRVRRRRLQAVGGLLGRGRAACRTSERGVHADPSKIHKINHVGERYSVEGPHFVDAVAAAHAGALPGRLVACGPAVLGPQRRGRLHLSPDPESARKLDHRDPRAGSRLRPRPVRRHVRPGAVLRRRSDTTRRPGRRKRQIKQLSRLEGVLCHALGDAGIDAGGAAAGHADVAISASSGRPELHPVGRARPRATPSPPSHDLGRAFERSNRIVGHPSRSPTSSRSGARRASTASTCITPSGRDVPGDRRPAVPELRRRGLLSADKSGTLRHKLSGGGRPAARDASGREVPRRLHRQLAWPTRSPSRCRCRRGSRRRAHACLRRYSRFTCNKRLSALTSGRWPAGTRRSCRPPPRRGSRAPRR